MFKYTMILDGGFRPARGGSPLARLSLLVGKTLSPLPGLEDPLQGGSGHPGLKTLGYSLSPLGGAQIQNRYGTPVTATPRRRSWIPGKLILDESGFCG